jgi:AmmeMemoRadiSam system protein B
MMGSQDIAGVWQIAGKIIDAVKQTNRNVRIVASSDFSHYVPERKAKTDDIYAIEALETLDIEEFYRRIEKRGVSACGYGPIAVMVTVAKELGASAAHLIRYATSGDATGDRSSVVGYAAVAVM